MVVFRDIAHEHTDLAVVDLPPVATPLALDPNRVCAALRETARIEGDDAIRLTQSISDLSHQHLDQRAMIPWCSTDECLHDLSLDIDERRNVLGILAWQVRQQSLEVEMHVALASLGLQNTLIGHHELAESVDHVVEHVRGNDAVVQQCLSPQCPHGCHFFAPSTWLLYIGCW